MIKINKIVITEGKYDKIRLSSIIDAPILTTEGFGIFKDKELQRLIRSLAQRRGLLVLTDSDAAGFKIRNFISSVAGKENVINAYIPDIYGKERRKEAPSKEGKLGVEGVSEDIILSSLEKAGVTGEKTGDTSSHAGQVTKILFYEMGLTGGENSSAKRQRVLDYYSLPSRLTTNSLITVLNCITDADEFKTIFDNM
ncbi:MAG: DUF4093 domain-containing protein [Clostridiales bacterium]|nr:DUF4093 domain-containing protein [Clostridiales bacterium]